MSYLHLPSMAVGDTAPIDDPSNCECGGKGCDCACHTPTRDNTNTDDDLEIDRLKENVRELRNHIDIVNTAHDVVSARVDRLTVERDAARTELAATKAGADHLQTSLQRANARIEALATESAGLLRERNDLRELLRMAGVML